MSARICVVGAGRWGANHARTLRQMGCLAGIVEADAERRRGLPQDFPGVPLYSDLSEALAAYYSARDFRIIEPGGHMFMLEKNWGDFAGLIEKWLVAV